MPGYGDMAAGALAGIETFKRDMQQKFQNEGALRAEAENQRRYDQESQFRQEQAKTSNQQWRQRFKQQAQNYAQQAEQWKQQFDRTGDANLRAQQQEFVTKGYPLALLAAKNVSTLAAMETHNAFNPNKQLVELNWVDTADAAPDGTGMMKQGQTRRLIGKYANGETMDLQEAQVDQALSQFYPQQQAPLMNVSKDGRIYNPNTGKWDVGPPAQGGAVGAPGSTRFNKFGQELVSLNTAKDIKVFKDSMSEIFRVVYGDDFQPMDSDVTHPAATLAADWIMRDLYDRHNTGKFPGDHFSSKFEAIGREMKKVIAEYQNPDQVKQVRNMIEQRVDTIIGEQDVPDEKRQQMINDGVRDTIFENIKESYKTLLDGPRDKGDATGDKGGGVTTVGRGDWLFGKNGEATVGDEFAADKEKRKEEKAAQAKADKIGEAQAKKVISGLDDLVAAERRQETTYPRVGIMGGVHPDSTKYVDFASSEALKKAKEYLAHPKTLLVTKQAIVEWLKKKGVDVEMPRPAVRTNPNSPFNGAGGRAIPPVSGPVSQQPVSDNFYQPAIITIDPGKDQ